MIRIVMIASKMRAFFGSLLVLSLGSRKQDTTWVF